jgi:Uri superfamily endonuclease
MMRKKRNDRNYILYRIESPDTGDAYIGLTVAVGRAFLRSVKVRVQKHLSRARREDKHWNLCAFLRENENVSITYEVLEVVRGRKPAYQRERELISELSPTLNTF